MNASHINRGSHANLYHKEGFFSLTVPKGKHKGENNILSFYMNHAAVSSVVIPRKEALYVVRKIKKEVDKARVEA
jgi:hypothetical protein